MRLSEYRDCLNALWAWLSAANGEIPECVTEEQALQSESGEVEGLAFLVSDAITILWYARSCYDEARHCVYAGRRALETMDAIVQDVLEPRPLSTDIEEDARLDGEREEIIASHELVRIERSAQAEALAALRAEARPADLREPAQAVGRQIAEWTARAL